MSHEILRVLGNWSAMSHGAEVVRVVSPQSFSGAQVWRVDVDGQAFALRRWQEQVNGKLLQFIHAYQSQLSRVGPPVIPELQKTMQGGTYASDGDGRLWELATWRPGAADYWQNPSHERLRAAMEVLAAIHHASKAEIFTIWPLSLEQAKGRDASASAHRDSNAVKRRAQRLQELAHGDWPRVAAHTIAATPVSERPLAAEAQSLISRLAPRELAKAIHWQNIDLPLQLRLGDVHHDHVLFTGDEVTGVIDFGAADYDAPAGDVARLLGSLVGDDLESRQRGLAAYQAIRQLSPVEVAAVDFFDSSGTVTAAANWIAWLWGDPEKRPKISRNAHAVERLARLVERLRALDQRQP